MKSQQRAETRIDVAGLDMRALIFMILICSAWGLNHPLTKMAYVDISPVLAAAMRSLLAAAGLLIYCRVAGVSLTMEPGGQFHAIVLGLVFGIEFIFFYVGILFYQSIGVACVSYLIYIGLLYRYQASTIAAFTFIAPVTGVLFSGIILAEPLTLWLWLGLAMVSAGLWLVNTR